MDKERFADELKKQIDFLIKNDILAIVEGKKDKAALNNLGIIKVKMLNKPLFAVVEDAVSSGTKVVALLVDMDKEGKKLYSKLNSDLSYRGIKINNELRKFLRRNTPLKNIEGLTSFLETSEISL